MASIRSRDDALRASAWASGCSFRATRSRMPESRSRRLAARSRLAEALSRSSAALSDSSEPMRLPSHTARLFASRRAAALAGHPVQDSAHRPGDVPVELLSTVRGGRIDAVEVKLL